MLDAVFLSASVPDPKRAPDYASTADTVAITAAVSALVYITLGRRPMVWGGHPAITPMIWVIANDLGLEYRNWVKLYQSEHFEDQYPEDNKRFDNVRYTPDIHKDREHSLKHMRELMFTEHQFSSAVFIGGMEGILQEYKLFKEKQPAASIIPIASTGGATLELGKSLFGIDQDLFDNFDYITLLHKHLGISPKEKRYVSPVNQPKTIKERCRDFNDQDNT